MGRQVGSLRGKDNALTRQVRTRKDRDLGRQVRDQIGKDNALTRQVRGGTRLWDGR